MFFCSRPPKKEGTFFEWFRMGKDVFRCIFLLVERDNPTLFRGKSEERLFKRKWKN